MVVGCLQGLRASILNSGIAGRPLLALLLCLLCAAPVLALESISDTALDQVQGAGIAVGLHNLKATMGPSTYIEATGVASAFPQADVRWYGLSVSATGTAGVSQWSGACTATISLSCPIGGAVTNLAYDYDPFVLRAFDYSAVDAAGTPGTNRTVLELLWPTRLVTGGGFNRHDLFKLAFWGEIRVAADNTRRLQSQTILDRLSMAGSQFRLFQHSGSDNTLGMQSLLKLSGDLRFSVNQTAASPNAYGQIPAFTTTEGLYFNNVSTYLPLGQLHYMSMILDDTVPGSTAGAPVAAQDGDFVIELTRVPNDADAYGDLYALGGARPDNGYRCTYLNGVATCPAVASTDTYYIKHGSWRIGDYSPNDSSTASSSWTGYAGGTNNTATLATDGVFFRNSAGTTVNLGDNYFHGMTVQHLKITTRGAGG